MGGDVPVLLVEDRPSRPPIRPIPLPVDVQSAGLIAVAVELCGWSVKETTGTATAALQFYNGDSNGGEIVGEQVLAAGASATVGPAPDGVLCSRGLYLLVVSGSVTGSVWVRRE